MVTLSLRYQLNRRLLRFSTTVAFLVILSACSKDYSSIDLPVAIWDEAKVLSQKTNLWLTAKDYPQGLIFVVRTIKSAPHESIGILADEWFRKDRVRHSNPDAFKVRGVYVFVTGDPPLIQVRVGDDIYIPAMLGGLIAGEKYLQIQSIAEAGYINEATREIIDHLIDQLPPAMERKQKFIGIIQDIQKNIGGELQNLSLPADNIYTRWLLKPFIQIRLIELRLFNTYWVTYVFAGLLLVIAKWAFSLLTRPLIEISQPIAIVLRVAFTITVGIALALGPAASAILLASARKEDQFALDALNLPSLDQFTINPTFFNVSTSIWLAITVAIIRLVLGFAKRSNLVQYALLPAEYQQRLFKSLDDKNLLHNMSLFIGSYSKEIGLPSEKEFQHKPFTTAYFNPGADDLFSAIRWFLLAWLFLPMALSLAAIYMWLIPTAFGLFQSVVSWNKITRAIRREAEEKEKEAIAVEKVEAEIKEQLRMRIRDGEKKTYEEQQRENLKEQDHRSQVRKERIKSWQDWINGNKKVLSIASGFTIFLIAIILTVALWHRQKDEMRYKTVDEKSKVGDSYISIASGVRVREVPQVNAREILRLSIGTVVQVLEKSASKEQISQNEDYWYRIAAPNEIQGWVFGSLIVPYDPAKREEIYWRIAVERLKVTNTTFGDQVDLASFLKRAATELTRPEIIAELELSYLLALKRSLNLIPSDKYEQPPFKSWLDAQASQILYHELGGIWIVKSDQFWALHKKYSNLSIGERIAWEGAINSLPGECEGYLPCYLERINITEGKYLAYYPKGNHAEEALTAISDSIQEHIGSNYNNYKLSSEERSNVRKEIDKIRTVILKTESTRKAKILQQLDRLNKL